METNLVNNFVTFIFEKQHRLFNIGLYKLLVFTFFCTTITYSQVSPQIPEISVDLPKIIPPSPSVASLMTFEEIPVDYYSGQPSINIPIFQKSVSSNLPLSLALNYATTNVRVDERSSWVGIGWSLEAGGVVSRTVQDYPDEINTKDYPISGITNEQAIGVYHNDFWIYDTLPLEDKAEYNWNARSTSSENFPGNLDNQLDQYQFNILGRTGRFIIVKEGNQLVPKLLSNRTRYKITLNYDASTYVIDSFTIIDENGYKYLFEEKEYTTSVPITISELQNRTRVFPSIESYSFIKHTSAWHLTEISNSADQNQISFNYHDVQENFQTAWNTTENIAISPMLTPNHQFFDTNNDICLGSYNLNQFRPLTSSSYFEIEVSTKKLSQITFKDGVSISFSLGQNHPEYTSNVLNKIKIYDSYGTLNKTYTFHYNVYNRLFLERIEEQTLNNSTLNTYLNYYDADDLPAYRGDQDRAGYYSTDQINETVGLLSHITYPTGGIKEFVFERNTVSYEGERAMTDDEFKNNPDNSTPQSVLNNFSNSLANPNTSSTLLFTLDFDQTISINTWVTSGIPEDIEKFYFELRNDAGTVIKIINPGDNAPYIDLSEGNYSLNFIAQLYIPDGSSSNGHTVTADARINYRTLNTGPLNRYVYASGYRIKQVNFYSESLASTPDRSTSYSYNFFNDANRSSGSVDGYLDYTRTYILMDEHVIACSASTDKIPTTYKVIQHLNRIDAVNGRGSFVVYKNVKVSETGNGYNEYEYRSPIDKQTYPEDYGYPFLPLQDISHEHGSLLSHKVFDEDDFKIIENSYAYNYTNEVAARSQFIFQSGSKCFWEQFSITWEEYNRATAARNNLPTGNILSNTCIGVLPIGNLAYDHNSGRSFLKTELTKEFFKNTNGQVSFTESRTEYDYNTENFQPRVVERFTKENGIEEHYKTELFYPIGPTPPANYEGTSAITNRMVVLNMINLPLYIQSSLDGDILSHSQNIYQEFNTDKIDLKEVKTEKSNLGIDHRMVYQAFDTHGNPLEVSLADGPPISYVWGHGKTLPVASVQNATAAEVSAALNNISGLNLDVNGLSLAQATALRTALSNALITTYTYDPLVGVTSVTDPRGYTMYYEYDEFNRLQYVRDADNNLISENQYHYKNQN